MYRSVEAKFWTDPKIRALDPESKLTFLYLITNPHSHLSGIYYLPRMLIAHETGLSAESVDRVLDTLSMGELIQIDPEYDVIWVVNMLRHQGKGEKINIAVANQLQDLHKCLLIKDFQQYYADKKIPYRYPTDGGSPQEQEQEQDKKQDKEQNFLVGEDGVSTEDTPPKRAKKPWTKSDIESIRHAYPKRVAPEAARKAIEKTLRAVAKRNGVDDPVAWLTDRVSLYAKARDGEDQQFTPNPATWFNAGRYDDDESEWFPKDHDRAPIMPTREECEAYNARYRGETVPVAAGGAA